MSPGGVVLHCGQGKEQRKKERKKEIKKEENRSFVYNTFECNVINVYSTRSFFSLLKFEFINNRVYQSIGFFSNPIELSKILL